MALVLLLMGSLFIVPCLGLLTTSLNKNIVLEQKTLEFYSADAGINDALWRIRTDELPEWILGTWDETTYSHTPYFTDPTADPPYPELNINQRDVETNIEPVWALEGKPRSARFKSDPAD